MFDTPSYFICKVLYRLVNFYKSKIDDIEQREILMILKGNLTIPIKEI